MTHSTLLGKIQTIKSGLVQWVRECYDSDTAFGNWAIGVGVHGELKISIPYTVKRTGELRYWIEAFHAARKGSTLDLVNEVHYLS